jgi:hypothetical protein
MITDEDLRKRIKKHHARKSKSMARYYANSFGEKDLIIWRSLCALYIQERIAKDQKRYLGIQHMIWLLAMKQYVVTTGEDDFWVNDVRKFINNGFKQNKSLTTARKITDDLIRAGYLQKVNPDVQYRTPLCLTMKARAFYIDLADLFTI